MFLKSGILHYHSRGGVCVTTFPSCDSRSAAALSSAARDKLLTLDKPGRGTCKHGSSKTKPVGSFLRLSDLQLCSTWRHWHARQPGRAAPEHGLLAVQQRRVRHGQRDQERLWIGGRRPLEPLHASQRSALRCAAWRRVSPRIFNEPAAGRAYTVRFVGVRV